MSLGVANLLRHFPVQLRTGRDTTVLCDALATACEPVAMAKLYIDGICSELQGYEGRPCFHIGQSAECLDAWHMNSSP